MRSLLNQTHLPRGLRNNNPGNLVQTNINWLGKIPLNQNTDSRFEQFQNLHFGLRALFKDLANDAKKHNGNVRAMIAEFAPSFENNTASYQQQVISRVGSTVKPCADDLIPLAMEIVRIENGNQYKDFITPAEYLAAAESAGLERCQMTAGKKPPAWLGIAAFLLSQM